MTALTNPQKKVIVLAILWIFFLLSWSDLPLTVSFLISIAVGAMTAKIVLFK